MRSDIIQKATCLLFFFVAFYTGNTQVPKEFKINIEVKSIDSFGKIYLEYSDVIDKISIQKIDSLDVKNNKFSFRGKISYPTTAFLYRYVRFEFPKIFDSVLIKQQLVELKKTNPEFDIDVLFTPIKQSFSLFLEPGEISIKMEKLLDNEKIEGPKSTVDFEKLKSEESKFNFRKSVLYNKHSTCQIKKDKACIKQTRDEIKALDAEIRSKVYLTYFLNNLSSPLAIYTLKESMPDDLDSVDKYIKLFYKLPSSARKLPSALLIKEYLDAQKKTELGTIISDFSQKDTLGRIMHFSSFKGQYILLDFWASWCVPCRKANPTLVKVFNKYHNSNFNIIGIALERKSDREKWINAIVKDKLIWTQLTDFQYWNNQLAMRFGIKSIPFNLLVAPDGKIIGKNIDVAELDEVLDEILK